MANDEFTLGELMFFGFLQLRSRRKEPRTKKYPGNDYSMITHAEFLNVLSLRTWRTIREINDKIAEQRGVNPEILFHGRLFRVFPQISNLYVLADRLERMGLIETRKTEITTREQYRRMHGKDHPKGELRKRMIFREFKLTEDGYRHRNIYEVPDGVGILEPIMR